MVQLNVLLPTNRTKINILNPNIFFGPFPNLIVLFSSFFNVIAGYYFLSLSVHKTVHGKKKFEEAGSW